VKHSYPDWIYETWVRDWGEEEALELMRAQNEPPETVVRLVRGEIRGEPTDVPGAWRVERVDDLALAEGRIWPQSRGSQLAGLAVGSRAGERVLDLCAAPGGESDHARRRGRRGRAPRGPRARVGGERASPGRDQRPRRHADGLALPPELTGFDRALVDAPCSGLGVLAGRPDLRWRARPLPSLQLALIRSAAERVKPGGTVVFSVCTLNAEENEAIVEASGLVPDDLGAGVAAVPPSERSAVPADESASPRYIGLLRGAAEGLTRVEA
jgi:16S rRNA (cytosine967-C5)-methyltransferase